MSYAEATVVISVAFTGNIDVREKHATYLTNTKINLNKGLK